MEWLAELGIIGLLAAAAAIAWFADLLRRLWPRRPELAVALAVVPLHNLVDFSLYTSGVALPWAVLLGWGMAAAVPGERGAVGPGRGRELVVAAAALAVAAALLQTTSVTVEASARAADLAVQRLDGALDAQRLAPWRAAPPLLAAAAAVEAADEGRLASAAEALERARWWRPRSAAVAAAAAEVALARGHLPTAAAGFWTAQHVQPRSDERRDAWNALVGKLAAVGDAARP